MKISPIHVSSNMRWLLRGVLWVLFCLPFSANAQDKTGPLVLEHADRLLSSGTNGDIVNLIGNVHLSHEGVDLYSSRATWYRLAGLVQFIDSVKVIDENRVITAHSMTYYRRDRRVTAMGDVKIDDSKQKVQLWGDKVDYYRLSKQMEATGHPHLIINPEDDSARMDIKSLRMQYFDQDSKGIAYDSVVITRRDIVARAGQAIFYREPEGAVLYKDPSLTQSENKLTGDTISIYTKDKKIDRLLVIGNAKAVYKTQPDTLVEAYTTAELTGKELEAFFFNEKIDKVVTRKNAISVYTPAITDTLTTGTNTASGDSITLYFVKSSIKRVFISGGAEGQYAETKADSLGKAHVDTTYYSGNTIDYDMDKSEINLLGSGSLKYQEMALTAGDIRYKTDTKILTAKGIESDTGKAKEPPILKQGSEQLDGQRMTYNLNTRKGQVRMARTKYDSGFYTGATIREVTNKELLVSSGTYTSCDLEEGPHYHFYSTKMKMINKNKVVARPVVMFIGQLPVFAIPYYVFPVKKGRHSGFTSFEFGDLRNKQRYIRNVGYYWAASQYWDTQAQIDYYENVRTIFRYDIAFVLRDKINSHINAEYDHEANWQNYSQRIRKRWKIDYFHSQKINKSLSLSGSGSFVSDKNYIADNILDPSQRLERTIRSTGSLFKRWDSAALNIGFNNTWNLDTGVKVAVLPSFSFSKNQFQIFPEKGKTTKKKRVRPGEETEEAIVRFYNKTMLQFTIDGQNLRQTLRTIGISDTTYYHKNYQYINTGALINSPQNISKYLTVTPGITLGQTLYRLEPNTKVDSLGLKAKYIATRETYSLTLDSRTTMYGTVNPNIFGLIGLRHVMSPSIGYRFTPETKKNQGYYSYTGVGVASGRSKSLTYLLGNQFQAKYKSGETEKKIDLFRLTFSTGYSFTALTRRIAPLSTSLESNSIPKLNVSFRSTHDFYNEDDSRRSLLRPRLDKYVNHNRHRIQVPPGDKIGE